MGSGSTIRKSRRILLNRRHLLLWFIGLFCCLHLGCAASRERLIRASAIASVGNRNVVQVKHVKQTRGAFFRRIVKSIPGPSERTQLLLRRYNLEQQYEQDPDAVINWFRELVQNRPTMEEIHGLAEIAEIQATWSENTGDTDRASKLYATALIHACQFLFDPKLNVARNAYDPQFRHICDVYNRSLEGLLREVCGDGKLQPNRTVVVGDEDQGFEFDVRLEGRWGDQEFERFELVNDYEATGIDNRYHTYGLGAPLIAVRKQQALQSAFEKYYPPEITLPMTAFIQFKPDRDRVANIESRPRVRQAILTLFDPLEQTVVKTESKVVPLESDITTPLAYGLRDPLVSKGVLATASLLNAEFAPESHGMFMLEPYDPEKIPVVMVHGLWSSPATWVHMFNDLRANQDIHENYQFWFYSYPTGQPFWISAQQMRRDLKSIRQEVDPQGDSKSLDQMVLVGHSMGGLMSLLQTMESEDHFWNVISDQPISDLEGDPKTIGLLRDTFYFSPNTSIDRVITLATPLRGSQFANAATQWVSQKLFTLPAIVTNDFEKLVNENKHRLKSKSFLTTATSIDSLAPSDPIFEAMASARQSKQVHTHNIIGRLDKKKLLKASNESKPSAGDGVVSIESARNAAADSETYVAAEHSRIHQHPGSIFEVRRVLLEHLAQCDRIRAREIPQLPVTHQAVVPEEFSRGPACAEPEFGGATMLR